MDLKDTRKPILLFDGSCGMCSGIVQFILSLKRGDEFTCIPLESPQGRDLTRLYNVSDVNDDTVLIIHAGVVYKRSDAAIFVFKHLEGWWKILSWMRVVPRSIRDVIYDVVAKHRRIWFGTSTRCLLPPPGEKIPDDTTDSVESNHHRRT